MAEPKSNSATIDDYIASFPPDVQTVLHLLRQTIRDEVPEATESIKYGMPTFSYFGNLVYFAAWKKHIGLYPITREMEDAIIELSAYKTSGKGTIQFPLDKPLPLGLIRKIVEFRVIENAGNAKRK